MSLLLFLFVALVLVVMLAVIAVRALGGNIVLVDDWRHAWRYYTSWAMLVIAMLPDLWNGLLSAGYLSSGDIPPEFSWSIKIALIVTFLIKQIKQVERPPSPFGRR